MCTSDIFLALIAILFPPVAVWIKTGFCTADSLINILLCVLGYIPGLLHAWYIIAKYPEPSDTYEPITNDGGESGGRVTHYNVGLAQQQGGGSGQQSYGSIRGGQGGQQQGYGGVDEGMKAGQGQAKPPPPPPPQQQQQQQSRANGGEGGSSGAVPPSYEQAVRGDHKVQT